jgi:hypothetical protein
MNFVFLCLFVAEQIRGILLKPTHRIFTARPASSAKTSNEIIA